MSALQPFLLAGILHVSCVCAQTRLMPQLDSIILERVVRNLLISDMLRTNDLPLITDEDVLSVDGFLSWPIPLNYVPDFMVKRDTNLPKIIRLTALRIEWKYVYVNPITGDRIFNNISDSRPDSKLYLAVVTDSNTVCFVSGNWPLSNCAGFFDLDSSGRLDNNEIGSYLLYRYYSIGLRDVTVTGRFLGRRTCKGFSGFYNSEMTIRLKSRVSRASVVSTGS